MKVLIDFIFIICLVFSTFMFLLSVAYAIETGERLFTIPYGTWTICLVIYANWKQRGVLNGTD